MRIIKYENFKVNEGLVKPNIYIINKEDVMTSEKMIATFSDLFKAMGFNDFTILDHSNVYIRRGEPDISLYFTVGVAEFNFHSNNNNDGFYLNADRDKKYKYGQNFNFNNLKKKITSVVDDKNERDVKRNIERNIYDKIRYIFPKVDYSYTHIPFGGRHFGHVNVNVDLNVIVIKERYAKLTLKYNKLDDIFELVNKEYHLYNISRLNQGDYYYDDTQTLLKIAELKKNIQTIETIVAEISKIMDMVIEKLNN